MSELSAVRFDTIRPYDDAVVNVNSARDLAQYAVERDLSKLKIEEGRRPIVFRCRGLTRDQRDHVREQGSDARQRTLAFRYGILEIQNLDDASGAVGTWVPNRRSPKDAITPDVLDALEQLGIGDGDIEDIGAVIMARSFLHRGVPPRCVPPDSSLLACRVKLSLRAAQSTGSLILADEEPSSAPSKPPPEAPPTD